jgi:hypothetical protein
MCKTSTAKEALEGIRKEETRHDPPRKHMAELVGRALRLNGFVMEKETVSEALQSALHSDDSELVRWGVAEVKNLDKEDADPLLRNALAHQKKAYDKDKNHLRQSARDRIVEGLKHFDLEFDKKALRW